MVSIFYAIPFHSLYFASAQRALYRTSDFSRQICTLLCLHSRQTSIDCTFYCCSQRGFILSFVAGLLCGFSCSPDDSKAFEFILLQEEMQLGKRWPRSSTTTTRTRRVIAAALAAAGRNERHLQSNKLESWKPSSCTRII